MCKFKKAIAVMLSAVMMLSVGTMPIAVNAATVESSSAVAEQTGTYNDFSYSINGTETTITGYAGTETEIEIPSKINGRSVTSIGDSAFRKSAVTNVLIPDTVDYIGRNAFAGSKIEKIVIPDSVSYLDIGVFSSCFNLKDVILSNNISVIEEALFFNCKSLSKIVIPNSVASLKYNAFDNCENLTEIILSDNIEVITRQYFGGLKKLKRIKLPANLKKIEWNAFVNCSSLTDVVIPDKVTTIEHDAFLNCPNLKRITLHKCLTEIGSNAIGYTSEILYNSDGIAYGVADNKIDGVTIYSYSASYGTAYAKKEGFNYVKVSPGDIDLDSDLTILDVTLMQRYCATDVELNDTQLNLADVDENDSVDINDATAIQRLLVE